MSDLISRQEAQAIKVLPKCYREYKTDILDDAYEQGWTDAMFSLNALPTIELFSTSGYVTTSTDEPPVVYAEQKRGKWIDKAVSIKGVPTEACSACGEWSYGDDMAYCPNCGARMDIKHSTETS